MIDNIESIDIKKYNCFSQRLSHEIRTRLNQVPIKIYKHKNGKLVNVFIMTKELSAFLVAWSANKPKGKGVKNE